ncbi:RadC family protein [Desulfolucanica intricata]|uniref:RadC family protein n=1 Tax=Desulfolucanica intricata TaxID=1285191 RepID=UPI000833C61B|nr:DNA repair protein RadC [Desulfolucanica intricata]
MQKDLWGNIKLGKKKNYFSLDQIRERGITYGSSTLNDVELIMTLVGIEWEKTVTLMKLLGGLPGLVNASVEQIAAVKGIGKSKAMVLKAAVEIGQRLDKFKAIENPVIKAPQDVADLLMGEMRYLDREHFCVVLLNTKNQVLYQETVSIGTLNSSAVHPREVFKNAIKRNAACIILVHNHPSGDPTPSREDIEVTKRLKEAGKIVGIEVLDHLVIGNGRFVSLKMKGLF